MGLGLEGGLLDSCGCWVRYGYRYRVFERLIVR